MLTYQLIPFTLIDTSTLYDMLVLREEVFFLEQKCTAEDLDGLDKNAVHVLGKRDQELIAVARILPPNVYKQGVVSFGRLAIKKAWRGQGYGREIMERVLSHIKDNYPNIPIEFSAQLYLKDFYASFGFKAFGEVFDEGGIEHIRMRRLKNDQNKNTNCHSRESGNPECLKK